MLQKVTPESCHRHPRLRAVLTPPPRYVCAVLLELLPSHSELYFPKTPPRALSLAVNDPVPLVAPTPPTTALACFDPFLTDLLPLLTPPSRCALFVPAAPK